MIAKQVIQRLVHDSESPDTAPSPNVVERPVVRKTPEGPRSGKSYASVKHDQIDAARIIAFQWEQKPMDRGGYLKPG